MKEIFVVTHTQATHHIERRVGGWYDSELTEKGQADAARCSERLQELKLEGVPIFTSDLTRTRQTAETIAERLGSTVQLDPRLREMSFGEAEGMRLEELDFEITSSNGDSRLDYCSVPGGETKRELASRLYEVLDEIAERERAIVCTHGYAATFLIAAWIRMPIESVGYVNFRVRPGSITHLTEDDLHANRIVASLGDTGHLDGEGE